jgi:hypothetical protein
MHLPINVKSPNNISKWHMGFNSAFKGLTIYKSLVSSAQKTQGLSYRDEAAIVICQNHAKSIRILCVKVWMFLCYDSVIYIFSLSAVHEVSHACS